MPSKFASLSWFFHFLAVIIGKWMHSVNIKPKIRGEDIAADS